MKILVIRNTILKLQEFATKFIDEAVKWVDKENPDIIVVAGNVSQYDKRSILFAEELAEVTKLKVIYNIGLLEFASQADIEYFKTGMLLRLRVNYKKTNVYWCDDFVDDNVQFRHVFGWPIITDTEENYRKTVPGHWLVKSRSPRYINNELVDVQYPWVFSVDEFNQEHLKENIPDWEPNKKRILLPSIAQHNDPFLTVNYVPAKLFGEDASIDTAGEVFSIMVV